MTRPYARVLYRLCAHLQAPVRVHASGACIELSRREPLPLAALDGGAASPDAFGLDARLTVEDRSPWLALWTVSPDHERSLDRLPPELRPQILVATPAGAAMVWIPPTPYDPDEPSAPSGAAIVSALAQALDAVPPGAEDLLPLPRTDRDVLVLDAGSYAEPLSLWSWAQAQLDQQRAVVVERSAAPGPGDGEIHTLPPTPGDSTDSVGRDLWEPAEEHGATSAAAGEDGRAGPAVSRDERTPMLTTGIEAVRDDLARSLECTPEAAVTRSVLVHAMSRLGSARVYELLGVRLTWVRRDGLYGWTGADWQKIA